MPRSATRIQAFDLQPGRVLGGKYVVQAKLGGGWEGEVYRVVERRTGVTRAAKLFFPQRNVADKAVRFYAKKLDRLRSCPIVIQYIHSESIRWQGTPVTCLISEYVEGVLLNDLVRTQTEGRLEVFEAMHLLYALSLGLEQIHQRREYHGDLHGDNVLVKRSGIFFDVKLVDFYHWGAVNSQHIADDVVDLVRLFYEAVGGKAEYRSQPAEVKFIVRGLRRDLITRSFPTARHLREHLESFPWVSGAA